MLRIRPLVLSLVLAAAVAAAPIMPAPQAARDSRRVPGRDERPVLIFPPAEGWKVLERNASEKIVTRSFQPERPTGTPGMDFATVTVMKEIWNADLEKAQHVYGRKLSEECEGVRATLWMADSSGLGRRLVLWKCEKADPPFAALQLLLQGRDDLFSIELFSRAGIPDEGQLVRWSEWLKDVRLCDRGKSGPPCPTGNWDQ